MSTARLSWAAAAVIGVCGILGGGWIFVNGTPGSNPSRPITIPVALENHPNLKRVDQASASLREIALELHQMAVVSTEE